MSNIIIDSILEDLKAGVIDAAKQAGVASLSQAEEGAKDFLALAIPTLERYVKALFSNPPLLTKDEIKALLEDLAFDALVHALTLGGKAEVEIERTQNTILQLATGIVGTALGKIIPA